MNEANKGWLPELRNPYFDDDNENDIGNSEEEDELDCSFYEDDEPTIRLTAFTSS